MNSILTVLWSIPWWAWAIFTYLLIISIKATKERMVYLPQLFIVPLVLLWFKRDFFLVANNTALAVYGAVFVVSMALSYILTMRTRISIVKRTLIKVPGDYATGILLMSFFVTKCWFGYLYSAQPLMAAQYVLYEAGVSAALLGFFLGRSSAYAVKVYTAK